MKLGIELGYITNIYKVMMRVNQPKDIRVLFGCILNWTHSPEICCSVFLLARLKRNGYATPVQTRLVYSTV